MYLKIKNIELLFGSLTNKLTKVVLDSRKVVFDHIDRLQHSF